MTQVQVQAGRDRLLVTDPQLIRTATRADGATYWNTASGKRVGVGRSAGLLLERLRTRRRMRRWSAPRPRPRRIRRWNPGRHHSSTSCGNSD